MKLALAFTVANQLRHLCFWRDLCLSQNVSKQPLPAAHPERFSGGLPEHIKKGIIYGPEALYPCTRWIAYVTSKICPAQFAELDEWTYGRQRDTSVFFLAQCAKKMGCNEVFGLRMRRHIVDAVQSAGDPTVSVRCTSEARVGPWVALPTRVPNTRTCM